MENRDAYPNGLDDSNINANGVATAGVQAWRRLPGHCRPTGPFAQTSYASCLDGLLLDRRLRVRWHMVGKMELPRRHHFCTMTPIDPILPRPQRLFLALWPDYANRGRITDPARQWSFSDRCMPSAPTGRHVALHFLGGMPAERVAEIADVADRRPDRSELAVDRPQTGHRTGRCRTVQARSASGRPLAQPGSAIDRPAYLGRGMPRCCSASACTLGHTDGANGAARGPDMSTLSSICSLAASTGSVPATCSVR